MWAWDSLGREEGRRWLGERFRIPVVPVGPRVVGGLAAEGAEVAGALEGVVGVGLVVGLPFGL